MFGILGFTMFYLSLGENRPEYVIYIYMVIDKNNEMMRYSPKPTSDGCNLNLAIAHRAT